jgi:hypothetical protein
MELLVVTVLFEDGSDMFLGASGDENLESWDARDFLRKER